MQIVAILILIFLCFLTQMALNQGAFALASVLAIAIVLGFVLVIVSVIKEYRELDE